MLVNPNHGKNNYLTKIEAGQRSENVSAVKYRIAFNLPKGGDSFLGHVTIDFDLKKQTENSPDKGQLFIDYKGRQIRTFTVNGERVTDPAVYINDRVYVPAAL